MEFDNGTIARAQIRILAGVIASTLPIEILEALVSGLRDGVDPAAPITAVAYELADIMGGALAERQKH